MSGRQDALEGLPDAKPGQQGTGATQTPSRPLEARLAKVLGRYVIGLGTMAEAKEAVWKAATEWYLGETSGFSGSESFGITPKAAAGILDKIEARQAEMGDRLKAIQAMLDGKGGGQ